MIGFDEYSWSFHGYSGKLWHNKISTNYNQNTNNEKKENIINNKNIINNNNNINNNLVIPCIKKGDIVQIIITLNRNQGKCCIKYIINNNNLGIAFKTIDPPITIGLTLVGQKEKISLLETLYKPTKTEKTCSIL